MSGFAFAESAGKASASTSEKLCRVFNGNYSDPAYSLLVCFVAMYLAGRDAGKRVRGTEATTRPEVFHAYAPNGSPFSVQVAEQIFLVADCVYISERGNFRPSPHQRIFDPQAESEPHKESEPHTASNGGGELTFKLSLFINPDEVFPGLATFRWADWSPRIVKRFSSKYRQQSAATTPNLIAGLNAAPCDSRDRVRRLTMSENRELATLVVLLMGTHHAWRLSDGGKLTPRMAIDVMRQRIACVESEAAQAAIIDLFSYFVARWYCRASVDIAHLCLCRNPNCTTPLFVHRRLAKISSDGKTKRGKHIDPEYCADCRKANSSGHSSRDSARYARRRRRIAHSESRNT